MSNTVRLNNDKRSLVMNFARRNLRLTEFQDAETAAFQAFDQELREQVAAAWPAEDLAVLGRYDALNENVVEVTAHLPYVTVRAREEGDGEGEGPAVVWGERPHEQHFCLCQRDVNHVPTQEEQRRRRYHGCHHDREDVPTEVRLTVPQKFVRHRSGHGVRIDLNTFGDSERLTQLFRDWMVAVKRHDYERNLLLGDIRSVVHSKTTLHTLVKALPWVAPLTIQLGGTTKVTKDTINRAAAAVAV